MQKRGRPSAADIAARAKARAAEEGVTEIPSIGGKVIPGSFGTRAEPPEDMIEPSQRAIWQRTVSSEPAEFFATDATRRLLRDYCRHAATVDKISEIIELFQTDWLKAKDGIKRYSELCKVRDAESRAAADKAVKLRLTNQARYQPVTAARMSNRVVPGKRPWED